MAISEVSATLIKYDSSDDQTTIYPKTLATNVTITANSNYSTDNLQSIISALGSLAFVTKTIVTSVENAVSGTLVDGAVIAEMNETLETLQTTISNLGGASYSVFSTGTNGLVPGPSSSSTTKYLNASGAWSTPTNTTYSVFSTSSNGLVPKPSSSSSSYFLTAAGTWVIPS